MRHARTQPVNELVERLCQNDPLEYLHIILSIACDATNVIVRDPLKDKVCLTDALINNVKERTCGRIHDLSKGDVM